MILGFLKIQHNLFKNIPPESKKILSHKNWAFFFILCFFSYIFFRPNRPILQFFLFVFIFPTLFVFPQNYLSFFLFFSFLSKLYFFYFHFPHWKKHIQALRKWAFQTGEAIHKQHNDSLNICTVFSNIFFIFGFPCGKAKNLKIFSCLVNCFVGREGRVSLSCLSFFFFFFFLFFTFSFSLVGGGRERKKV